MTASLPPDPGPRHPDDLRRILVLGQPPGPWLKLRQEAAFTPDGPRYVAGAYRVPGGRLVTVVVDAGIGTDRYEVQDALTGKVVRAGVLGEDVAAGRAGA